MLPSPTLFRAWGIPVKLHWTLLCLLPMVLSIADNATRWLTLSLLPASFLCILLHEFGHALVAQRKHLEVRDIYLHPLGGLARIGGTIDDPLDELQVAAGGPLVTLLLAVGLIPPTAILAVTGPLTLAYWSGTLAVLNLVWFVFNLIPAYPMDGGRVLKVWWTLHVGPLEASRRASVWGRTIGWIMVMLGVLFRHVGLVIIGGLVIVTSAGEYRLLRQREAFGKRFGFPFRNTFRQPPPSTGDFVVGPAPYEEAAPERPRPRAGFFPALVGTAPLLWSSLRRPRFRWGG